MNNDVNDANAKAAVDKAVEDDIKSKIAGEIGGTKSTSEDPGVQKTDDDVKNRKKTVDTSANNDDNNTGSGEGSDDEQTLYDSVIDKVIAEEFGGDNTKRKDAEAIANVAIKTFNGDPIKAAKSYKSLFDQSHSLKNLISSNPVLEKLLDEAKNGTVIDENYIKSRMGTATSNADQPNKPKGSANVDELDDDFDLDKLTADELVQSGVLDKTQYDAVSAVDKRDMLEKARIKYGYKVLPQKMAERTARLAKQEQDNLTKKERLAEAEKTNKARMDKDLVNVMTQYGVDFDKNPEHAALWKEVENTAWRIPDLSDNDGVLVAENAVQQAVQHVFQRHGVQLPKSTVAPTTKDPATKPGNPTNPVVGGSADAMRRILSAAGGFKGVASKREPVQTKKGDENSLDARVSDAVSNRIGRNYNNSHMISGLRKSDRQKT